jgi:cell division protein FtsI (penicillin-binding protein 3)
LSNPSSESKQPSSNIDTSRTKKVTLLFVFLVFGFLLFLAVMLFNAIKPRNIPSKFTSNSERASRGDIISYDGFHVASTKKLYKAVVNTKNIDPQKKELFIQLFSIYSGMSPKQIETKLNKRRGSVVLSYAIAPKEAQYLKSLAYELLRLHVFVEYVTKGGRHILQGLSILESGEKRVYAYDKLLTPVIGYPRKTEDNGYTRVRGIKGIEKYYDDELSPQQDSKSFAPRDVNSYMIMNKQYSKKEAVSGMDVKITIPVTLQLRIEKILSKYRKELKAKEIMSVIMDSRTGRIYSIASSNRFYPTHIKRSEYPSLNTGAIEYSYEPGSVIKPIVFSLLLNEKLVNPYDLVNVHNGRYKIGRKTITDEHKYDWLSAENVIVHSSNIGIAQLAQKLGPVEYYQGLIEYGFAQKSGLDLPYEKSGVIPSINQLSDKIYKATASYGYGMRMNLMQLVKAYNAFNNNGRTVTPYLLEYLIDPRGNIIKPEREESVQVIRASTAQRMKKILVKTVIDGTGKKTITPGIEVGGKTGTAHIAHAKKRGYANRYNTSFVGFANDKKRRYTMGVTVVEPTTNHFASLTAVPVFKEIIDLMIDEGYLKR